MHDVASCLARDAQITHFTGLTCLVAQKHYQSVRSAVMYYETMPVQLLYKDAFKYESSNALLREMHVPRPSSKVSSRTCNLRQAVNKQSLQGVWLGLPKLD